MTPAKPAPARKPRTLRQRHEALVDGLWELLTAHALGGGFIYASVEGLKVAELLDADKPRDGEK